MQLPRISLFDWLIENMPKAKYDFANSSITGVPLSELLDLTGFHIPEDLNLGKNDPFGAPELRRSLARIYHCEKNNVVSTTGGSEANFLVFLALLHPGDEVIVEQPGYSPLWLVPKMLGAHMIPWKRQFENDFSLNLEELKELVTARTKVVVITNLHNPSGVLEDTKIIQAAAEIVREHDALLLIDEIFLDVSVTPQRSAAAMDSVIITSSVSKVYGIGGLRTGWIIAAEDIAKQCLSAKWQTSVAAPYFSELLVADALETARDKLINRCKSIAKQNFPIVKEWIEQNENYVTWVPPAGGVLCFPRYQTSQNIDSVELCKRLIDEKGILASPGEYFGLNGHFRLSFMNPQNDLHDGLKAIAEVLMNI